jgi:hypothetical protein
LGSVLERSSPETVENLLKVVFGRFFGARPGTKKTLRGKKLFWADFVREDAIFDAIQPLIVFSESSQLSSGFAVNTAMPPSQSFTDTNVDALQFINIQSEKGSSLRYSAM